MSEVINLSQLIARLSEETGADSNTARLFVREFFGTLAEALAAGETVELPGIGTFKRSSEPSDDGQPRVLFRPDESLALDANAPFSMFAPTDVPEGVELEDKEEVVEEQDSMEKEDSANPVPAFDAPEPSKHTEISEPSEISEPAVHSEPSDISTPVEPSEAAEPSESEEEAPTPSFPEEDSEEPLPEPPEKRSKAWIWILIIGLLLGIAGGAYFGLTIDVASDISRPAAEEAAPDSVAAPEEPAEETAPQTTAVSPESPAPVEAAQQAVPATTQEPVYETVSSNNYLSVMARRHYGAQIYWVYIYEANADRLGHPDRIAPGTRVVIPPKSTFPAAANEDEARRMAQQKANEIMARYR